MSEKHTPMPWIAIPMSGPGNGNNWVVMSGNIVIATFTRKDYPEWNRANARFIVKACNSHDALLLDACRNLVSSMADLHHPGDLADCRHCRNVRIAKAAIAEKEG